MNSNPRTLRHLGVLTIASALLVGWVVFGFGLPPIILKPGSMVSAPALIVSLSLAAVVGYTSGVVMIRGVYWQKVVAGGLLLFAVLVATFILIWVMQRAEGTSRGSAQTFPSRNGGGPRKVAGDSGKDGHLRSVFPSEVRAGDREKDAECGTVAHLALDLNVTLVLLNHILNGGEAQAESLAGGFGGEEGFENVLLGRGVHAATGVGDREAEVRCW